MTNKMYNKMQKFLGQRYGNYIQILSTNPQYDVAHNVRRLSIHGLPSESTFDGTRNCGLSNQILQSWIPTLESRKYVRTELDDHIFSVLKHKDDEYIIDGTWKQMFVPLDGHGDDPYHIWLYEKQPVFFADTLDTMLLKVEEACQIHFEVYGVALPDKTAFWTDATST